MKKLPLIILIALVSCKKDPVVNPDVPVNRDLKVKITVDSIITEKAPAGTANKSAWTVVHTYGKEFIETTAFNPCTNEDYSISGYIIYHTLTRSDGAYEQCTQLWYYDNMIAIGVTSGKLYKGFGYSLYKFKSTWKTELGSYMPTEGFIRNKVVFKFPGANNDITTVVNYTLQIIDDQPQYVPTTLIIDECR